MAILNFYIKGATLSLACLILPACAINNYVEGNSNTSCAGTMETQTTMFFGRDIANGGAVSGAQWDGFARTIIAKQFPMGFTTSDAIGFWQDRETKITGSENSKMVLVFHPGTHEEFAKIHTITNAYINRFDQQAVIGASSPSCVVFYEPAQ